MVCNTCHTTSIVGRVVTGRNTPGTAVRYRNNTRLPSRTYQPMALSPQLTQRRYETNYGPLFVAGTLAVVAITYLLKRKK